MFGIKFKNTQIPQLWVIPISFAFLIIVGTILFKMPFSLNAGKSITWVDSLFVATSAVSITGLSTIPVGEVFDFQGQLILLCLVQLGGIGIFTSSLIMVVVAGQRLSLADEQVIQATIGKLRTVRPVDIFIYACFFVFFFEALGSILYLLGVVNHPGYGGISVGVDQELFSKAFPMIIWDAVFHSVNAFCNSGFSLYPEGLIRMRNSPYFLLVIGMLVLVGSLGLMTLINLRFFYFWRRNPMRRGGLLLQTKITLIVTACMIVVGMVLFLCFERNNTLQQYDSAWLRIVHSFFQSVNARSGGLNSVDLSQADPATLMGYIFLMFVGGGSGSMAGGIKVTTFFVILITAWAVLRRREYIQLFERRIPAHLVHVALMIGILYIVAMVIGTFCLVVIEDGHEAAQLTHGWLGIAFEAMSAFGTVGLTTGVTPILTSGGKLVIITMMYVGRILTLTLAVYLLRPWEKSYVKYPEEQLALG